MPLKNLKPEELESTRTLIAAIERKDRRFRLFQTLFMVGTFLALIIIIGAQQRTLGELQESQKQAEQVAIETAKRSSEQQDTILRRLDCMSVFFNQTNRTNLTIDNIDKCTLSREGNIQEFFRQEPGEAPETTREPQNLTPSPAPREQGATSPPEANPEPPIEQPPTVEPRPPLLTVPLPLVEEEICLLGTICLN